MLASGASLNSQTLQELFEGLGGLNNLQALENSYQDLLKEYKVSNNNLACIWYLQDETKWKELLGSAEKRIGFLGIASSILLNSVSNGTRDM